MAAPIAFESSWGKTAERQQLKEARELVLAKAKQDYEKEERRREAALKRGEGTWMLPCVSDRIDQEQQELAKVKKKKSHKEKKHKKEKKAKKKSKKHGHKRKDDDSSNSDSDDAAMWVEKPTLATSGGSKAQQPCASSSVDVKGPKLERDSWMSAPLDLLPSVTRDDIRRKKMEKTEEEKAKQQQVEEMGRHKRELNPYWKEGGKGLPEEEKEEAGKKSVAAVTGDAGVGWLRRAYKRCEETAVEEGRTLDEVAAERYGSLAKLKQMLRDAEKTLERLKEEERQERYGRREDDRRGRQQDHQGRGSDGGRRWEGRDRDRTPPRDRDRAKYGSRDRDSDRDRVRDRGNRALRGEDRPRRGFMKPGGDNDEGGRHSSRGREDHSPGRQRRGFLKPGEDTECQSSSQEPRREKLSFKRPVDDDDDINAMFEQRRAELKTRSRSPHSGWRKESTVRERRRSSSGDSDSGSAQSESESSSEEEEQTTSPVASQPAPAPPPAKLLTEEEMNRLGAKVLRAEMMGNETLAAELKQQLDEARKVKASTGALPQGAVAAREGAGAKEGEEVVLTRTDRSGMVRPLPAREYPDESHSGKRRKKPKVETHKGGERERYFDDDDKYSLKALVEREKLGTAEDQNTMFARLAGRSVEATNDDYQVDDVFVNRAARHQSQSHVETRERQLAIIEHKQMAASLEKCSYCFEKVPKHLIISIGKKVYLCLPNYRSMAEGHCLIVPMMHATQATALDEDVWEEIQVFRKALTRMFTEDDDEDCVFMEICTRLKKSPHMVIECVPLPRELGDMAPIYFKKALLECDTEWTENKKVIDLSQKDVRRAVPKGFPYFAVDFGLQGGFAHVIEDETHFPHYFGREIVGGMLDLEPTMWRKHQKENFEDQRKKVLAFAEKWKPYDWTQRLDSA